jgi:uncharacterized protein GlcG (DUF336 family)
MGMSHVEYADTVQLTKRVDDAIMAAFEQATPKARSPWKLRAA